MSTTSTPRIGDWMQTFTGLCYYPADPRVEDINIVDIAHALSNLCRFGGHCNTFYSVAEHSILVSLCVPPEHALQALLHDATEAYCVDVPRPLKRQLTNYAEIEHRNWLCIAEKFGVPVKLHKSVHQADNDVLLAEKAVLLGSGTAQWSVPGTPADVHIRALRPARACDWFIDRFNDLTRSAVR